MSLIAKPPALVMLAGALWLTAVDLAWAESPASKREHFIALVANRQDQVIANRLQQQFTQLNAQSQRLLQQQNAVTGKITTPPPPPVLVRLNKLDQQLQQQSARIMQRLQKLNNMANSNSLGTNAFGRLRNDLTRQEATITNRIQSVTRLQRAAATPFAPGGF
jgi:hypothetical protein